MLREFIKETFPFFNFFHIKLYNTYKMWGQGWSVNTVLSLHCPRFNPWHYRWPLKQNQVHDRNIGRTSALTGGAPKPNTNKNRCEWAQKDRIKWLSHILLIPVLSPAPHYQLCTSKVLARAVELLQTPHPVVLIIDHQASELRLTRRNSRMFGRFHIYLSF